MSARLVNRTNYMPVEGDVVKEVMETVPGKSLILFESGTYVSVNTEKEPPKFADYYRVKNLDSSSAIIGKFLGYEVEELPVGNVMWCMLELIAPSIGIVARFKFADLQPQEVKPLKETKE